MTEPISASVEDRVLVISIEQPATRNAMTADMAAAIATHLDRLDDDAGLSAAVLHGRGGRFSSGMDLKAFRSTGRRPVDARRGGGGLVWDPPIKPLVAAVDGYALGLGFEMVLACDLVVASQDAEFALPEVTHGLVAAGGGMLRLPRRLPRPIAIQMLLTGERMGARRLYELGLVNLVASEGASLQAALELAHSIAALPTAAVQLTKRVVDQSIDWPESQMFQRQEPLIEPLLNDIQGKS